LRNQLHEKFLAPELKLTGTAQEGPHIFSGDGNVNAPDTVFKQSLHSIYVEPLRLLFFALNDSGLQMREVYRHTTADVQNKVIEIPSFDPALPVPEKQRMQLAGKEARQIVKTNLERCRQQMGFYFGRSTGGGVVSSSSLMCSLKAR
jgi:hypothetical protein